MSKVTNKQIAKAFERAVRYLDSGIEVDRPIGTDTFICWAITRAACNHEISPKESYAARLEISRRIFPHNNIRYWLEDVAKIPTKQLTRKNVQAYRHAWLQSLIKEFENA